MIRYGFVADLHAANHRILGGAWQGGLNDRARMAVGTFDLALRWAQTHKLGGVMVLGDVFDTVRPEPQIIEKLQSAIAHNDIEVDFELGNHDQASSEHGDHALGPLAHSELVRVYDKPDVKVLEDGAELWVVPYQAGAATEWLPGALEQAQAISNSHMQVHSIAPPLRLLALHLGIHDVGVRTDSKWAADAHDAVGWEQLRELMRKHGIRAAFAGNWHRAHNFHLLQPSVHDAYQVGTLCPTGWDNPGLDGYGGLLMVTIDKGNLLRVERQEVAGPRFLTAGNQAELDAQLAKLPTGCRAMARMVVQPADATAAREYLQQLQAAGSVHAWRVDVDKEHAQQQAKAAAVAARSTTTLQGVLAAYVEKMPLPPGVQRSTVFARAKEFLQS